MKKISLLLIITFILFYTGCLEYTPELTLTNVDWYTGSESINNLTFGYVHLQISGSTTGGRVTVITYGDGVISELELDLDQNGNFSQDVVIQFTHLADDEPRIYSTIVTAYQGNRFTRITLESEELVYL
ncbi:MAG: hypothetical protein PHI72_08845 [Atribacterota bacterium]|nr:hypothetical protein [Atribacterota bacterium]MDD4896511.1 hypothetical protein [Atribacterota bacterium]MDD5637825.1 hypothetical protein [Atribacterota bacterium]